MKLITDLIKKIHRKGGFHVFAGQLLTKFVAFFASIFVVRLLTKEQYGILGYYENLYSYAVIFSGLGLANAVIRYVVKGCDIDEKRSFYRYVIKKSFLIDLIICFGFCAFNFVYKHPSNYINYSYILLIFLIGLPFQDISNCCLNNERAMFANSRYAVLSVTLTVTLILCRIVGAAINDSVGIAISQVVVYIVCSISLAVIEYKHYYSQSKEQKLTDIKRKEVDRYSFQYMITNGLWAIFMLNDVYMLGRFGIPTTELADYKVAYVLPANLAIISTALGIVVAPYFIKNENNLIWIRKNFKNVLIANFFIILFVAILLAIFSKPVVVLLYGKNYGNVAGIMQLLTISSSINSGIRYPVANLLAAMGKVKYNMLIALLGVCIQIVMNIIFIPILGTVGTIVANIIAHSIMSCLLIFTFFRNYYSQGKEH